MAKELKVYGCGDERGKRIIVAATTKKAAYQAFVDSGLYQRSYSVWDQFVSATQNEEEIEMATAEPGKVFFSK